MGDESPVTSLVLPVLIRPILSQVRKILLYYSELPQFIRLSNQSNLWLVPKLLSKCIDTDLTTRKPAIQLYSIVDALIIFPP